MLPPFLRLRAIDLARPFHDTIFEHKPPVGPIRALWWPTRHKDAMPSTIMLFFPGNPGILDFYIPFLTTIHDRDRTSTLAIMAHSHIGHSPDIDDLHSQQVTSYSLPAQVQNALEAYDAIRYHYGHETEIVLTGHSVGAWIALQVLKARQDVEAVFLLFPTIVHISQTPRGKTLGPLFAPIPRFVISVLSHCTRILPNAILSMMFASWPGPQIRALRMLLDSPRTIWAAMAMAYHEMQVIKELDVPLLTRNRYRLYFYFAEQDDWVGRYRDDILKSIEPGRVVQGQRDIPHAFCISHGEQVGFQCHEWLAEL